MALRGPKARAKATTRAPSGSEQPCGPFALRALLLPAPKFCLTCQPESPAASD